MIASYRATFERPLFISTNFFFSFVVDHIELYVVKEGDLLIERYFHRRKDIFNGNETVGRCTGAFLKILEVGFYGTGLCQLSFYVSGLMPIAGYRETYRDKRENDFYGNH